MPFQLLTSPLNPNLNLTNSYLNQVLTLKQSFDALTITKNVLICPNVLTLLVE